MRVTLVLLLLPPCAYAQSSLVVSKINSSATKFSASVKGPTPDVGQTFDLKGNGNGKCEAAVTKSKGNAAILAFTECAGRKEIKPGDKFTQRNLLSEKDKKEKREKKDRKNPQADSAKPSSSGSEASADSAGAATAGALSTVAVAGGDDDGDDEDKDAHKAKKKKADKGQRFSLYGFYNSGNRVKFKTFKESTTQTEGEAEFKTDSGFGLGLETWRGEPNSWGWSLGLSYDAKKKVKSIKIKVDDAESTTTFEDPKPEISLLLIYANVLYTAEQFYIPAGVNYSLPQLKQPDDNSGSIKVKGALGFQLGFGWHFFDFLSAELLYRVVSVKATQSELGSSFEYSGGTFSGAQANLKLDI